MLPGAIACSNGDTWASELGTVVGQAEPLLIISRRRVPRGKHLSSCDALEMVSMANIILFHFNTANKT
jgi:uncharacterized membrane protein